MELSELLLHRRSVREYTGEAIPEEKLRQILQAGLLSPSGRSRQPWEFVAVQNKETLEQLSHCRVGASKMLKNAGCAILVFANPDKTDVWTEDCSIAMSNMHLMADNLGLGSCWIQGRLREAEDGTTTETFCKKLLHVPEQYRLEAILSVGVIVSHPEPHNTEELPEEKIHFERY